MINYEKKLITKYETDVCVVGGGPAGVAAAIAAARQGVKVFIIESQGFFGGAATASLVPAYMPFDNGVDFLAGGIGKEIYDELCTDKELVTGRVIGAPAERLKRIYDDMIDKAGVDYLFFTNMVDVIAKDGMVESIVVAAKSGMYAISAKVFIDGTGDGDLCAWAGAPFEKGDKDGKIMPSTLCSIWVDIDYTDTKIPQNGKLEEAFADGVFSQEDRHLPGIFKNGKSMGGGNIGHAFDVDATDEKQLTRAMVDGRRLLPQYQLYYNKYLGKGYKDAYPVITGSCLGIRETRRIMGDYVLDVNDFNTRASFNDEIGRFSYPVDIHISAPTKEAFEAFHKEHSSMRYKDGESYGIPYRILLPQKLSNVYVTGRCVSTDKQMQSSIRVMPSCYITGQAAGIGAAMCVKSSKIDIRAVDVGLLQQSLIDMGAFIPNRR